MIVLVILVPLCALILSLLLLCRAREARTTRFSILLPSLSLLGSVVLVAGLVEGFRANWDPWEGPLTALISGGWGWSVYWAIVSWIGHRYRWFVPRTTLLQRAFFIQPLVGWAVLWSGLGWGEAECWSYARPFFRAFIISGAVWVPMWTIIGYLIYRQRFSAHFLRSNVGWMPSRRTLKRRRFLR